MYARAHVYTYVRILYAQRGLRAFIGRVPILAVLQKMAMIKYFFAALILAAVLPFGMPTSHCEVSPTDMTLVSGANGKDVVLATVQKIEGSMIFPDNFDFLRRMAAVQTKDGAIIPQKSGGIWGIGAILNDVNTFMNNDRSGLELAQQIEGAFCFNWYNDVNEIGALDIPLYSALAVMIRLSAESTDILDDIEDQAIIWKNTFNADGVEQIFVRIALALDKEGNNMCYRFIFFCFVYIISNTDI